MAKKAEFNELGMFTDEQQFATMKCFIEDRQFQRIIKTIQINGFTASDALRWVAVTVKELVAKDAVFDYNSLRVINEAKTSDEIRRQMQADTIDKIERMELSEAWAETIKNAVYELNSRQCAIKLSNSIMEAVKARKDGIRDMVRKYTEEYEDETANANAYVTKPSNDVAGIISKDEYEFVPTEQDAIDTLIGGGLNKGGVALLQAGSGIGKTSITTGFVCGMAIKGNRKVVHFVLEDRRSDIEKRYVAYFTKIPVNQLLPNIDEATRRTEKHNDLFQRMRDNIRSVYAIEKGKRMKTFTVADIDTHLTNLERAGFYADAVVIDYYDTIKRGRGDVWVKDEDCINELLRLAIDHNVALWVPTQGTKAAQNRNTELGLDTMSGGSWKSYRASLVMTFKPDGDMFIVQTVKNRFHKCRKFRVSFDNGTGRFGKDFFEIADTDTQINDALGYQMGTARSIINKQY